MTRLRSPLTAPGSPWSVLCRRWGRRWAAALSCAAVAGCGSVPGVVTYAPGPVAPSAIKTPAAAPAAVPAVVVAEAVEAPSEPSPIVPAGYQVDEPTNDAAAAPDEAAPLPAPLPEALSGADADVPPAPRPLDDGSDAVALTLDEAEAAALANNPTLAGAMAAVNKARGLYTQVGLGPNPTVGVTSDDIGEDDQAGRYGVYASQTFVRGNKLGLSQAVESWEVRGLQLQADAQRLRTLTDVRQRFIRVVAAQRQMEIAGNLVSLAEAGVKLAEDLLDAGEVARPDLLQAQVQAGETRIAQRNAEIARDAAWRELMAAIGTPGRPVQPVAGTLDGELILGDFEELYEGILAGSPEIAAARARIERAKAAVCRQQVQPIPNVVAQASLSYGVAGDDAIGGFQVGLPLPLRNDNRGNVAAAIADVHRAVADLNRLELNLRSRLAVALAEYESAQNRATRLAEDVLPAARENLDLSEQGYRQGEFDAIRVATARRSLFEAELARVNAAADRQRSAALIDGLLLSGALNDIPDAGGSNLQGVGLRGEALSGQ